MYMSPEEAQAELIKLLGEEGAAKLIARRNAQVERYEALGEETKAVYQALYYLAENIALESGDFSTIAEAADLLSKQFQGMQETREAVEAAQRTIH